MASGGGVPPSLKAYQPYIVLAKQYETKKDIVTSYYCKFKIPITPL